MTMGQKEKKLFIVSFEDASILRKFTILFLLSSIVPLVLLYYIYSQGYQSGELGMTQFGFFMVMLLVVLGIATAFMSMRSLLMMVINITRENNKALTSFLSKETIQELNKGENEIVILSRSFSAVIKQLEDNIKSLELAKKTLQTVMEKVGRGISNMQKIDTFLDLIVETMNNALSVDVSTLLLLDDKHEGLNIKSVFGVTQNDLTGVNIKIPEGSPFYNILKEKKPQVVSGIFAQNIEGGKFNVLFRDNLLCVPLLFHDHVNGIITLSRTKGDFSQDDITLVFNLACQTAVALENARLNNDIEKTYFETISALAMAVDAKDKYSRGHLDRVTDYVVMIGKKMGLDEGDMNTLRDGARLHDLGKIGIPDEVLLKEGALSDEDWVIMRRHPEIGESIIKPVRSLQHLCDLIRHHHEKLDGTGYPDRLKGDEITALARILAVADIYDALSTDRSYRSKRSKEEAFALMRSMKDHLDQDIVATFIESMLER